MEPSSPTVDHRSNAPATPQISCALVSLPHWKQVFIVQFMFHCNFTLVFRFVHMLEFHCNFTVSVQFLVVLCLDQEF
ncbi:hypothetical protein LXL04_011761 [Taraxacum kok-saghyz]